MSLSQIILVHGRQCVSARSWLLGLKKLDAYLRLLVFASVFASIGFLLGISLWAPENMIRPPIPVTERTNVSLFQSYSSSLLQGRAEDGHLPGISAPYSTDDHVVSDQPISVTDNLHTHLLGKSNAVPSFADPSTSWALPNKKTLRRISSSSKLLGDRIEDRIEGRFSGEEVSNRLEDPFEMPATSSHFLSSLAAMGPSTAVPQPLLPKDSVPLPTVMAQAELLRLFELERLCQACPGCKDAGQSYSGQRGSVPRVTALQKLSAMRGFFHNIVLILNYNHARDVPKSVDFWRMLYERLFNRIVVVSDDEVEAYGVMKYPYTGPPNSSELPGFYAYSVVPRIMAQHPQAEGFLWTNDDLILNYWTLLGADKSKIWYRVPPPASVSPLTNFALSTERHRWPRHAEHFNRTRRALSRLPPGHLTQFLQSLRPKPISQVRGVADVYYVPQRFVRAFTEITEVFLSANLWSEIAVPTMLLCLDSPSRFDPRALREIIYVWGEHRRIPPERRYNSTIGGLHPWKLKTRKEQEKVLLALSQGDPSL